MNYAKVISLVQKHIHNSSYDDEFKFFRVDLSYLQTFGCGVKNFAELCARISTLQLKIWTLSRIHWARWELVQKFPAMFDDQVSIALLTVYFSSLLFCT